MFLRDQFKIYVDIEYHNFLLMCEELLKYGVHSMHIEKGGSRILWRSALMLINEPRFIRSRLPKGFTLLIHIQLIEALSTNIQNCYDMNLMS